MARNKSKSLPKRRRPKSAPPALDSHSEQLSNAIMLHRAGQLDSAKQIYIQIISESPTHSQAWHLLGMALYSAGAHADALQCLQQSRTFGGDDPEMLGHMALVLHANGNTADAISLLKHLLSITPNNAEFQSNLGVLYLESNQPELAREHLTTALAIQPDFPQASMNLANCLVRQNQVHDAEVIYRDLLKRDPDNLDVLGNLGECLRRQSRFQESIDVLNQVIPARPEDLASRLTHARATLQIGEVEDAAELFKQMTVAFPYSAKAFHFLGTTLQELGDLQAAEKALTHGLQLSPNDADALCSIGYLHLDSERRQEAYDCFKKALHIDPAMSDAHGSLCYLMTGDPSLSPESIFEEHVRWGELHGCKTPICVHTNDRTPNRPLRIGYASGDFRMHAVARFFEPLLRLRDKQQFETFCYYESGVNDQMTQRLKSLADHWRVTYGYSDQQVAQQVLDDRIDILVDLSGHTLGNRLTAWSIKPAPIQISWLGYPNTTGLDAIDYTFTCEVQNPHDEPTYHTEQLIRIPGGSFSFQPPPDAPEISKLPSIERGRITLGSLHRPFKISSKTLDYWTAALRACPDAALLLFNTQFNELSMHEVRSSLIERGVADARIEIRNQITGDSYLEIYREIDIALDATPWAGGTTTMEALWMGIPLVAVYGNSRPSRGTAGIVHHLGYPDWIAADEEDYGVKVASLASDIDRLVSLRQNLRDQVIRTIANEQRFVTEVENAYRTIWGHWCQKAGVAPIPATELMTTGMPGMIPTNG
ncbi:tetratricopeptide repeat protein [Rhodopirellula sp. MGV]|uniref:O-linked N-acetylglucosamine transferase, SPINDLY family protein n=1 Tax=Rhodopirellula sp. MGV TaxID=2023130 RepID=UPI001304360F|nr:glycosyltransferase family 41 protein [Rhodopirellula sp. MGV]